MSCVPVRHRELQPLGALALGCLLTLASCQKQEEPQPSAADSMQQGAAEERRTLEEMLSVLDDKGLAFEEVPEQPASIARDRVVLELQTTLQTEIELARRKLAKTDPSSQSINLLGQARAALDRHQLGAFIRQSARAQPGMQNDAALLFTELETAVRAAVARRLTKLPKP